MRQSPEWNWQMPHTTFSTLNGRSSLWISTSGSSLISDALPFESELIISVGDFDLTLANPLVPKKNQKTSFLSHNVSKMFQDNNIHIEVKFCARHITPENKLNKHYKHKSNYIFSTLSVINWQKKKNLHWNIWINTLFEASGASNTLFDAPQAFMTQWLRRLSRTREIPARSIIGGGRKFVTVVG